MKFNDIELLFQSEFQTVASTPLEVNFTFKVYALKSGDRRIVNDDNGKDLILSTHFKIENEDKKSKAMPSVMDFATLMHHRRVYNVKSPADEGDKLLGTSVTFVLRTDLILTDEQKKKCQDALTEPENPNEFVAYFQFNRKLDFDAVNAFRKNYKRKFLQQCGINPLETAPDGELMENHFTLRYIIK